MLPFESLRENGLPLTHCRRVIEERSSMLWKLVNFKNTKHLKESRKSWEDTIQWLRSKSTISVKDF